MHTSCTITHRSYHLCYDVCRKRDIAAIFTCVNSICRGRSRSGGSHKPSLCDLRAVTAGLGSWALDLRLCRNIDLLQVDCLQTCPPQPQIMRKWRNLAFQISLRMSLGDSRKSACECILSSGHSNTTNLDALELSITSQQTQTQVVSLLCHPLASQSQSVTKGLEHALHHIQRTCRHIHLKVLTHLHTRSV